MEPKNAVLSASFVLMLASLVLWPAPAQAHDPPRVAEYAGRSSASLCSMQQGLAGGQSAPSVGGCVFEVEPGEARVVIQDWSEPSVTLRYTLWNVAARVCAEGEAVDEVVVTVDGECNQLTVVPGQRAVAGRVFVV